ncbi:hypothetical protein SISNIDRAFT_505638 [Sistotremastrum niveocremeum HHB9708]|uniref:DUF202 domain-containing protein n=1 Tax=Sistotremastrum niveocremeum HHB9708 TaxID=1314777 RepID=A0A164UWR9_9AGAM|nr:hypothetical protein SISNIDRAFT_505638 [Sistotremastrum niveocremeum HHB9708]
MPEAQASSSSPARRESKAKPWESIRLPRYLSWISLTLENSGSVARDHLASERTWLAYIRTSLAIASAGVALVQLFTISMHNNPSGPVHLNIQRFARPLGSSIVLLAKYFVGIWRFFDVQNALTKGQFSPARATVVFLSSALVVLVAVVFGVLVSFPRA